MLTHVDLFSGLGGFALAAAANGIRTVQFCEIDQRCREFLSRAWPGVPCHDDVRTYHFTVGYTEKTIGNDDERSSIGEQTISELRNAVKRVYLLTAGVPCQPASRAGKQRGAEDNRWLWPEAVRILSEVRPVWALFENPPGIGDVGLAGILAQVENEGYEVRVFSIPACALGSPQRRERYWIVCHNMANAAGKRQQEPWGTEHACDTTQNGCEANQSVYDNAEHYQGDLANTETAAGRCVQNREELETSSPHGRCDTNQWGNCVWLPCADGKVRRAIDDTQCMAHGLPVELLEELGTQRRQTPEECEVHRSILGALGNSIVWSVAAEIIRAMVQADETM